MTAQTRLDCHQSATHYVRLWRWRSLWARLRRELAFWAAVLLVGAAIWYLFVALGLHAAERVNPQPPQTMTMQVPYLPAPGPLWDCERYYCSILDEHDTGSSPVWDGKRWSCPAADEDLYADEEELRSGVVPWVHCVR